MTARDVADRVMGSAALTAISREATKSHIRILAYHGVDDGESFTRHMAHLVRHYQPISPATAAKAIRGEIEMPHRAVWVTFDDGHPSVIETALPIMVEHAISGTLFVCPGLVDTALPYWWEIVEMGLELGETPELNASRFDKTNVAGFVAALKSIPDGQRREIVQGLNDAIVAVTGEEPKRRQVTTAQLETFIASGGDVGNHTWDHPCLDTCSEPEVVAQIESADRWLTRLNRGRRVFAYPNGNHTPAAKEVLGDLRYRAALLFDHRLASHANDPLALSRLRVNDHTTIDRFAAIVAGVHPALHRLRSRLNARVR